MCVVISDIACRFSLLLANESVAISTILYIDHAFQTTKKSRNETGLSETGVSSEWYQYQCKYSISIRGVMRGIRNLRRYRE